MHVVPAQHATVAHDWPKRAHEKPPSGEKPESGGAPASVGPPSACGAPPSPAGVPGGGVTGVQVPWIDPGGATHGRPAQQSAFVVHDCPPVWHEVPLHCRAPPAPGTHGWPLQHSLAVEHELPLATQPTPPSFTPVYALQRGTPSGSSAQAVNFGVCGPQQSERALETPQV
jgi:hypothetical protein